MRTLGSRFIPILIFFVVPCLRAQAEADWSRVVALRSGKRIELRTASDLNGKLRARLRSATQEEITVLADSGVERTFARGEIRVVLIRRSNIAPIAGAVTVGVFAAGALWGSDGGSHGERVLGTAGGVGVGWLIGKAIQRGNWKTVYKVD
jgi:hypothetical protein